MSLPECRACLTPGTADLVASENPGKPQTLNPVTLHRSGSLGVLPGPFHPAPGPPSPKFGGYLFPLSQSHTILVCPNADRARLECGVCVSVCTHEASRGRPLNRPPPVSAAGAQGPLDRGRPRSSGPEGSPDSPLLPCLAEDAEVQSFSSNLCPLLWPVGLGTSPV